MKQIFKITGISKEDSFYHSRKILIGKEIILESAKEVERESEAPGRWYNGRIKFVKPFTMNRTQYTEVFFYKVRLKQIKK